MAISTRAMSIGGSVIVALLFILGAYVLSSPNLIHTADASSIEDALKAYATKDTDADGLEDWREAIYGTDPNNPKSFNGTLTDGEAVEQGLVKPRFTSEENKDSAPIDIPGINAKPDTLTSQFSRKLLEQYLLSRGSTKPSSDDIYQFVETAVKDLPDAWDSSAYRSTDVKVSGSGVAAVELYMKQLGAILASHSVLVEADSADYFYQLVAKGDNASVQKLQTHAKQYKDLGKSMMLLSVPAEIASAHLRLANAFSHMGYVVDGLSLYTKDPLLSIVSANQYLSVRRDMATAVKNMAEVLKQNI